MSIIRDIETRGTTLARLTVEIGAIMLCAIGAIAATFLSGINFPEQNNIWHLPIVLDFFRSDEGPHDAYNASFIHFVSAFWLAIRPFTNEGNVQALFVALQLIGNAGLATALYGLVRVHVSSVALPALATTFCCFCYGLWGATRLGYSEVFVTYATHTQFSIIFCLLCLILLVQGRIFWAAVLLSLAAYANLFIAVWGGLVAGAFLIWNERRLLSRTQFRFASVFLLIVAPLLVWVWAIRSSDDSGAVVPTEFYLGFLRGHVYALSYPQALVQTFALLLAGSCAVLVQARSKIDLRPLGVLALSATAVLALGVVMPYLTEQTILLSLNPLRFNSVAMILTVACGVALLVTAVSHADANDSVAPFIAVAGFLLKLPMVSVFGFALLMRGATRGATSTALALVLAATLGLLLPTPIVTVANKSAVAFLLMSVVLLLAVGQAQRSVDGHSVVTAGILGALSAVPLSAPVVAAVVLCLSSMGLSFVTRDRHLRSIGFVGFVVNALAALLVLYGSAGEPFRLATVAAGLLICVVAAALAVRPLQAWWAFLSKGALVIMVFVLIAGGLAKGAISGFSITPTASQRDWTDAQRWARNHMAIDAMVLPLGVPDGFSLFSRRPVWWEASQGAAILWMPSFYAVYMCRSQALTEAPTPAQRLHLAIAAGIDFLIIKAEDATDFERSGFASVFRNTHYVILRNDSAKPAVPLCPDAVYGRQ